MPSVVGVATNRCGSGVDRDRATTRRRRAAPVIGHLAPVPHWPEHSVLQNQGQQSPGARSAAEQLGLLVRELLVRERALIA